MIRIDGIDYCTAAEANVYLGADCTPQVVRAWGSRGKVTGYRVGRETYYDLDALTEIEYQTRTSTRGHSRMVRSPAQMG